MSKEFINPAGLTVCLERYGGVTEHSKAYFQEHKDEIGDLLGVVCLKTGDCEWRTYVIGYLGYIQMDGFSFGYYGEGSRGLEWLLEQVCGLDVDGDVSLGFYIYGEWDTPCIAVPTTEGLTNYGKRVWMDKKRRYAH